MLQKEPLNRISAERILRNPWFKDLHNDMKQIPVSSDVINNMMKYKGASQLKRAAMNMLVKQLNPLQLKDLHDQFEALDIDKSGLINADEIMKAIQESGMSFKKEEVDKMIEEVDYIGNHQINYSEFLSATLSCQKVLTDELLWTLFKQFDIDDTNFISIQNLREVFRRLGRYEITEDEIKQAIEVHDTERDNKLSFAEFKRIFFEDTMQEVEKQI